MNGTVRGAAKAILSGGCVAIVLACTAGTTVAAQHANRSAPMITQTSIAGAPTGMGHDAYTKLFGSSYRLTLEGTNYPELVFAGPQVEVAFPEHGSHAIIVITWNRHYRTSKGVGPCSTVARLKQAYGDKVKPAWSGTDPKDKTHISSYVVGTNLLFATADQRTIAAVALYRGNPQHTHGGSPQSYANYAAASASGCTAA